jgi:hypothetical protein
MRSHADSEESVGIHLCNRRTPCPYIHVKTRWMSKVRRCRKVSTYRKEKDALAYNDGGLSSEAREHGQFPATLALERENGYSLPSNAGPCHASFRSDIPSGSVWRREAGGSFGHLFKCLP